jgi:hypothetical protein
MDHHRKQRIQGLLPMLSKDLANDIRQLMRVAEAIESLQLDASKEDAVETATTPPPNVPTSTLLETNGPTVRRAVPRTTTNASPPKKRRRHSKPKKLSLERKDDLRLQLLKADKKGDGNIVRRTEKAVQKSYGKRLLSGLRVHASGEWKGPFIARLLKRKATRAEKTALLKELSDLYGETVEALMQATKKPSPGH